MSNAADLNPNVLQERLLARLRMRHLHLVAALASAGHLGRAAEAIHVSQPAATQMLREIERLLGVRLFERHARGMRATEVGRTLALQAGTMIDALRVASDGVVAHTRAVARPLRVGALPAAIASLLRPAMRALLAQPDLRLHISEDTTERLNAGLSSGALDAVLLRRPAASMAGQRFIALRRDRLAVLASPRHPAARQARVRWADLAGSRWLLPPEGYAVRGVIDAAMKRARVVPIEHPIHAVTPSLIEALLGEPDVIVPGPHSVLDTVRAGIAVELKLALRSPLEPLGVLYRVELDDERARRTLGEFIALLQRAVA